MYRHALVAALLTATLARAAQAQTADPEAEHQRGVALRNEHRDAEALEVFRGLYERTGEVRALARMALAEAALSRWIDAEGHLQRALSSSDAWVVQNRASLDLGLVTVRQHLGNLVVSTNQPGAEVFVSGQRVATTPFEHPLRVAAGALDIEVRAADRVTARRTVNVRSGLDVTAIDVELARAEPAEPTPMPTQLPDAPRVIEAPTEPVPPMIDPQVRRDREERRATWEALSTTGFVLGGAGLLTGIIALGVRESAVTTFNSNGCQLVSEDPLVTNRMGHDCSANYNRGETSTLVSITGFAAGAVFAIGGVVARVVAGGQSPQRAFACGPALGGAGVACAGRF